MLQQIVGHYGIHAVVKFLAGAGVPTSTGLLAASGVPAAACFPAAAGVPAAASVPAAAGMAAAAGFIHAVAGITDSVSIPAAAEVGFLKKILAHSLTTDQKTCIRDMSLADLLLGEFLRLFAV